MKDNYRKLGELVDLIDERNSDEKVKTLIGVSIDKCFIKSVANTIGTDLSKYQIIRKNDFACSLMQVSRDGKIPIACLKEYDEAIMSPAYYIFRIKDTSKVLPDYLTMWFMRTEFDREASYIAVGGVRGSMPWEDFCNMELPVPDIEEQQKIVNSYNIITKRIQIKQRINENLEKIIKSYYKKNCITFDELPDGWSYKELGTLGLDISDGNYSTRYPKYDEFVSSGIPFIRGTDFRGKFISTKKVLYISETKHAELLSGHTKRDDILISTRGEIGKIAFVPDNLVDANINSQLVRINGNGKYPKVFIGACLTSEITKKEIAATITGSVQAQLPMCKLLKLKVLIPSKERIDDFSSKASPLLEVVLQNEFEITKLQELTQLVISHISKI